MKKIIGSSILGIAVLGLLLAGATAVVWVGEADAAWQPTKPVEFNVPAGTGGGADIMARFISPLFQKNKIVEQPFIVVNRSGGAGAEGFLHVKGKKGDPNTIIITLDNLFTTPLATGVPFNWKDLTPVARLALDYFILWVHADSPYKTAKEYFEAVKKEPGKFKMAGTGTKQEDQIITVQLEQAFGLKFAYVPFKGGGTVAVELVGKHVDSTVNNPSEQVSHWRAGNVRPLAVIAHQRIPLPEWDKIPTLKEATGVDLEYTMLRGIFAPPGIAKDVQEGYIELFKKVVETPEWKDYLSKYALAGAFLAGPEYASWLEKKEAVTKTLMEQGGMLKK
ncbi:MAG TPA: tripartite tricarboxylate transporter substrate binding protein [Candidatus Methylomirabilis sp.]|nr:tripartite tricarboxylate transporter substrate binding protein [Candidatus Methylomirabilis sp.]